MKEQIDQLQNEIYKLNEEITVSKENEKMLKECEVEKLMYTEKNSELQAEIDELKQEKEKLHQKIQEAEENCKLFNEEIEHLRLEVKSLQ